METLMPGSDAGADLFGIISCIITYSISRRNGKSSIVMIVLAGMVISAVFEALVSLMKYVADPEEELPTITLLAHGKYVPEYLQ